MALTNYERQKKWREKNRVIYNLRRRNARKNLSGADKPVPKLVRERVGSISEPTQNDFPVNKGESSGAIAGVAPKSGANPVIEALRELVKAEQEKPATEARTKSDVVGGIYRNDSGGVISKFAWEKLQKMKEKAKQGGYHVDEYSQ